MIKKIQREYHSAAFQLFMEYFEKRLEETKDQLCVAEDNNFYRLQGRTQILKELLQLKEKREIKYAKHDGGFGAT